jgi:hypothetical protein
VRLFTDPVMGAMNGSQNAPPTPQHPSGMNWGPTPITAACHDITTFPEIGLAAGACEGNGLLIDISDPANPVRIDAVADPNCAYWHGRRSPTTGPMSCSPASGTAEPPLGDLLLQRRRLRLRDRPRLRLRALTPTAKPLLNNYELSENEIKAAAEVQLDRLTPQH